jgi:hypothetical protein
MAAIDEMVANGTVNVADKKLILLTDDIEEAIQYIHTYIDKTFTVKPRKRLWWLFEKR